MMAPTGPGEEEPVPNHDRMRHSNEQLRFAREQFPSRRAPGERLSRQELAELVNQWVFDHDGKRVELDENYIGKLERGVIRWPNTRYRQALRAILRATTDGQLGFYIRRRASTGASVTGVNRQQFLRMAGTVMALPWLDLFGPTEPTTVPARVGRTEIDQMRAAVKVFISWDNTFGGGLARDTVMAQLRWSAQHLHADCPEPLRPELFAAVAELCTIAGMMAFDAGAHDDARRVFRFGLACAEQADNWHVRSCLLGDMAVQAMGCGGFDDAVTYAETALVRAERLTVSERSRLLTVQARAYAKLHRTQDTMTAIEAADEAASHDRDADNADRSWEHPYDHTWQQGHIGQALFDLAMGGQQAHASTRLAYAVDHHQPGRPRTLAQIKYATFLMAIADPYEAAAVGHQALDAAANLSSCRVVDDLRALRDHAERHQAIPAVKDLSDRIYAYQNY